MILSFVLCGTISAFAGSYMHREAGFNRFFTLFAMFMFGIVLTSVAGTIETLFAGWELVGLIAVVALLIAAVGGGRFSIDGTLAATRRRRSATPVSTPASTR